jgi:Mrp family chromosome partitioning ATPase
MVDTANKQYVGDPTFRRAALLLSRIRDEKNLSSVMITSATKGEGVSTVTHHLAEALQLQHGVRPVVVELNASASSFAKEAGLDSNKNIQNVVDGSISLDQAIQTAPSGLPVLLFGSPSKGLGVSDLPPERLVEIIRQLESDYDLVLVDGPSILDDAEGLAVAGILPRIVLVVRSGHIRHEVLDRLRKELENHHVDIVGMVLNGQKRVIPNWIYGLLAR